MAKTTKQPSPKKAAASPKNKVSGTSKKQPAKSKMITTMEEVQSMTLHEFGQSLNRIDWAADDFTYECEEYTPKYDPKNVHEAFLINRNGKDIFVGDTKALPMAEKAENNPAQFIMQLIAYKRLNSNLSALKSK